MSPEEEDELMASGFSQDPVIKIQLKKVISQSRDLVESFNSHLDTLNVGPKLEACVLNRCGSLEEKSTKLREIEGT